MIVKFFRSGSGGSAGVLDYMLGKERDREGAKVLYGDADETARIIDYESSRFAKRYTSGCLSFEESDIPEAQKLELMQSFESTLFAGMDADQYDILWIEHQDKGRLELNFVIPNVELTTQKRLQPYYVGVDKNLVNSWRTLQNIRFGFTDPEDPEKKQTIKTASDLPRDRKEAVDTINQTMLELVKDGVIRSREDVINTLEGAGFEIARITPKAISIKPPEGGQNIRLRGHIYEQHFRISEELQREIGEQGEEFRRGTGERYASAHRTYQSILQRKYRENKRMYRRERSDAAAIDREPETPRISERRDDQESQQKVTWREYSRAEFERLIGAPLDDANRRSGLHGSDIDVSVDDQLLVGTRNQLLTDLSRVGQRIELEKPNYRTRGGYDVFKVNDRENVRAGRRRVFLDEKPSDEAVDKALDVAIDRFGSNLDLRGSGAFVLQCMRRIVERDLNVTLKNKQLNEKLMEGRQRYKSRKASKFERSIDQKGITRERSKSAGKESLKTGRPSTSRGRGGR